jgi:hypothetical protein
MSPERRVYLARLWVEAEPHNPEARREMTAAIVEYQRRYDEARNVFARINAPGGEA